MRSYHVALAGLQLKDLPDSASDTGIKDMCHCAQLCSPLSVLPFTYVRQLDVDFQKDLTETVKYNIQK